MTVGNSLRSSFVSALQHPTLWLAQFFGNAVVVGLFVLWLHIPEAHWWQLVFQFVIAALLIVCALVLHGGVLNYYAGLAEDKTSALSPALKNALRHAVAFAAWVCVFYLVLHFVDKLDDYQYSFPGYLRSEAPAWLRRQVSESAMDSFYLGFVAFLRWVVVPGLLLPLGLLLARTGFAGFLRVRAWGRALASLPYWIVLIAGAFIGVYCTSKLMGWKLHAETAAVTKEGIWLGFRMLIAYLLALFSWFWVCAMMGLAHHQPEPPAASQKIAA